MPDTDSVVIVKRFVYRGNNEEWSNRYHLEGTTPTTPAGWKALYDAIIASEKTCYTNHTVVVQAYGYTAGNDSAIDAVDYRAAPNAPVPGTLASGAGVWAPGDAALWLRWSTPDRTVKGKPIYLRKYFHDVLAQAIGGDAAVAGQVTAMTAHGNLMKGGTLPGAMKVCGPQGADAGAVAVSSFITTRTLKRRGKRPPTSP